MAPITSAMNRLRSLKNVRLPGFLRSTRRQSKSVSNERSSTESVASTREELPAELEPTVKPGFVATKSSEARSTLEEVSASDTASGKTANEHIPTACLDDGLQTGLLGLPFELRLEIYRYVLHETDKIFIGTSIPPEPGLLGVNRQLRQEAGDVYYGENRFSGHIFHYDTSVYLRWRQLARFNDRQPICKWRLRGSRNWTNLKAWLKADFEDNSQDLGLGPRDETRLNVDIGTFKIVRKLKSDGKCWEEVEAYLDDVHEILIAMDSRWK